MTGYTSWMQYSQQSKDGTFPTEGNPVANHEVTATTVATGVAPVGAQYASVWADVASTVSATNLNTPSLGSGLTYALPAGVVVQIPNITPGKTTITFTDI